VSANAPADPNIQIVNYYGAEGSWKDTGIGENYYITFKPNAQA
jgi:hypothetical protein